MSPYKKWLGPVLRVFSSHFGRAGVGLLAEFDELISLYDNRDVEISLIAARKHIASRGFMLVDVAQDKGGSGLSSMVQAAMQFIAGYHSLDNRDLAHVAHGRMIIEHGSVDQLQTWVPRLASGELVGIASTEEHGGSAIQATRTCAIQTVPGRYVLNGRKRWISRIEEASAFVVFFRLGDDGLSAALLPRDVPGLEIETRKSSGLDGWSWGCVNFNDVMFTEKELLGTKGDGLGIFRGHFEYYRPMVAIAALGAAASVFDEVVSQTRFRLSQGHISRCRDSALEHLGFHFQQLNAELLAAFYSLLLKMQDDTAARLWSRVSKAGSVAAAHKAVSELSLLCGASSFQYDHKISKAERDLRGLLFADGMHSELLRSAGQMLLKDP